MRSVLSVSLPEKVASQLDAFAQATGRNKSDIVKESISLYLWDARFKQTRRRLIAKAKMAGIVSDEDVFKVVS